jgi:hypothetical protein
VATGRYEHDSLREGAALGVIVATGIWLWLAGVDAVAGQPFRTFHVLGGTALFTVLHVLLCVAYGVVATAFVHGARREPSLIIGAAFAFLILQFAFAMIAALLSQIGLGGLAWVRILGGNLVGAVLTLLVLSRRHPLRDELRQAERAETE